MSSDVKVSLYAGCYEAVGQAEIALPLKEPCTVEEFIEALCQAHPSLQKLRRLIVCARGQEYLEPEDLVSPGDHLMVMSAYP